MQKSASPATGEPTAVFDFPGPDEWLRLSHEFLNWLWYWFDNYILTGASAMQVLLLALSLTFASVVAGPLRRLMGHIFSGWKATGTQAQFRDRLLRIITGLTWPLSLLLLLSLSTVIPRAYGASGALVSVIHSLVLAWVVIRLFSNFFANSYWSRVFAWSVWVVAALSILGLLQPAVTLLDDLSLTFGDTRVSLFMVFKGAVVAAVLLWLAFSGSRLLQRRVEQLPNLTPSARALISQTLKISLLVIAVVATLNTVGIDLTAFAVFSGAIGVGLGFGLQRIVANLVSGIILLMDHSVKPGDVIEVSGTYGVVSSLGARYTAVITRDGTEYLIPNEDLIVNPVINWSHSSKLIRRKAPIGIGYGADVDLAMILIVDAARETARVLHEPPPVCQLKGFGDSAIDLEVRFWIDDPEKGLGNVTSAVLVNVWRKFKENEVEIPFPQRDLHLRSAVPIQVNMLPKDTNESEI